MFVNHFSPMSAAPSPAVMSKIRGLSLDLPEYDDFDRAFDDGFSPSKIELPREFCGKLFRITNHLHC